MGRRSYEEISEARRKQAEEAALQKAHTPDATKDQAPEVIEQPKPHYALKPFNAYVLGLLCSFKQNEIISDPIRIKILLEHGCAIAPVPEGDCRQCPKCKHVFVGEPVNAQ